MLGVRTKVAIESEAVRAALAESAAVGFVERNAGSGAGGNQEYPINVNRY
jgi:hypothetical protein